MSDIQKPNLETAIQTLYGRDEYQVILRAILTERENYFGGIATAKDAFEMAKHGGGAVAMDFLIGMLDPENKLNR